MANPAVKLLELAPGQHRYVHAGDVVRVVATGEALSITSVRGGQPRYWRPVPFHRAVWGWLRRRGWRRIEITERYTTRVRFYRRRPSPLPHRLP